MRYPFAASALTFIVENVSLVGSRTMRFASEVADTYSGQVKDKSNFKEMI